MGEQFTRLLAVQQKRYEAAVAAFKEGLALDIQDKSLTGKLQSALRPGWAQGEGAGEGTGGWCLAGEGAGPQDLDCAPRPSDNGPSGGDAYEHAVDG